MFIFQGQSTYKIKKKIGEGGFAKVFVAECQDYDMTQMVMSSEEENNVAIKVFTPALSDFQIVLHKLCKPSTLFYSITASLIRPAGMYSLCNVKTFRRC